MTQFRIVLHGDYGVGKTSLTTRLLRKKFDNYSQSTIGASFMTWKPNTDNLRRVSFGIWDTAGQERFNSLVPMYLRNADAIFYCWDCMIPFDSKQVDKVLLIAKEAAPDALFYLVLTKVDKLTGRKLIPAAEAWIVDNNIDGIHYTSSFTGDGVQDLFTDAAKDLLSRPPPPQEPLNLKTKKTDDCCQIL